MSKNEKYELTDKQIDACKKIEKALKEARKAGVSILAKSDRLYGYKSTALDKACPLHEHWNFDYKNPVPCYPAGPIRDAGADDTEYFPKGFLEN